MVGRIKGTSVVVRSATALPLNNEFDTNTATIDTSRAKSVSLLINYEALVTISAPKFYILASVDGINYHQVLIVDGATLSAGEAFAYPYVVKITPQVNTGVYRWAFSFDVAAYKNIKIAFAETGSGSPGILSAVCTIVS